MFRSFSEMCFGWSYTDYIVALLSTLFALQEEINQFKRCFCIYTIRCSVCVCTISIIKHLFNMYDFHQYCYLEVRTIVPMQTTLNATYNEFTKTNWKGQSKFLISDQAQKWNREIDNEGKKSQWNLEWIILNGTCRLIDYVGDNIGI